MKALEKIPPQTSDEIDHLAYPAVKRCLYGYLLNLASSITVHVKCEDKQEK